MGNSARLLMRKPYGLRRTVVAGIVLAGCCLPMQQALAAPALPVPAGAAATEPVSPTPATGTPKLTATGVTETVRQLVQCGGTMYAVGSFTEIQRFKAVYARNNIFSFQATAPYHVKSWDPDVNGEVNSIAFKGTNCANAYIGGQFTAVNGTAAANLAEISTTTGALVPGFGDHTGGGHVDTIVYTHGHLLVGGTFTSINGSTADPYYASISPVTGLDDGFLHLAISGDYVYHAVKTNSTELYNQQLSHSGKLLLAEGDFTSVGGLPRQQVFMLNVAEAPAKVTSWSSPEFDGTKGEVPDGYPYQCGDSHPFYIHAAAWSPDDSTIYLASTGVKPWNWDGTFPLVGICDAISAFPATEKEVIHDWVNYTGCNSLYSVAADDSAVYVAGHERWADDQDGCKTPGPGHVNAPGLGAFTPGATGGSLIEPTSGSEGLYSRSRGHGADDMLLTTAGLWIASDNFGGGTSCGGLAGFAGICFLPYSS
jgi:hypothetical protein